MYSYVYGENVINNVILNYSNVARGKYPDIIDISSRY